MKRLNLKGASSDAILLTFIKLVTTALGLAITRLLAEYLAVYEYGTYSQIMLLVSTISSITMFGMMDGVNFFYAGKPAGEERESYIATIFALQCTFSTVAGCVVMAMEGPLCDYFENADAGKLLIFAKSHLISTEQELSRIYPIAIFLQEELFPYAKKVQFMKLHSMRLSDLTALPELLSVSMKMHLRISISVPPVRKFRKTGRNSAELSAKS